MCVSAQLWLYVQSWFWVITIACFWTGKTCCEWARSRLFLPSRAQWCCIQGHLQPGENCQNQGSIKVNSQHGKSSAIIIAQIRWNFSNRYGKAILGIQLKRTAEDRCEESVKEHKVRPEVGLLCIGASWNMSCWSKVYTKLGLPRIWEKISPDFGWETTFDVQKLAFQTKHVKRSSSASIDPHYNQQLAPMCETALGTPWYTHDQNASKSQVLRPILIK